MRLKDDGFNCLEKIHHLLVFGLWSTILLLCNGDDTLFIICFDLLFQVRLSMHLTI